MRAWKFFGFFACLLGVAAAVSPGAADGAPGPDDESIEEYRELLGEISHLNLLRGLYLSKEQLSQLIPLAEEAVGLVREKEKRTAASEEYLAVCRRLRDALYTSTGPSDELRRAGNQLHTTEDAVPNQRLLERLGELEQQVRDVLSDAQIRIIDGFVPCFNPPQSLKDPVAVGQASTTEIRERELDLIRRMPEALYAKRRAAIIEPLVLSNEKEMGRMSEEMRAAAFRALSRKLAEIRRLSAVDFELKKAEYVRAFRLIDETVTYDDEEYRHVGQVGKFMLNPRMLKAMKQWQAVGSRHGYETQSVGAAPVSAEDRPRVEFLDNYARLVEKMANQHHAVNKVISRAEWQQCLQDLEKSKDSQTLDERLSAIDRVAQRLRSKAVTQWSVEAMFPRMRFLCIQKGFFMDRSHHLLGLGDMAEEAKEALGQGEYGKAFAIQREITGYVLQFKD